jgi:hypothetical protein
MLTGLYSNHLSAQLNQDYLNQNGHHNNASVGKKISASVKTFVKQRSNYSIASG